jgi:hypothetical protein
MLAYVYAMAVLGAAFGRSPAQHRSDPSTPVRIDSARHELVLTSGPFSLPSMTPMSPGMLDHGMTHDTPIQHFTWPVDGWLRGFRFEVLDAEGRPLPRELMHHVVILNFDRRQLLYPMAERVFGAGAETDDASIPRSIGVPFPAGSRMGMYVAWHNDSGKDLKGVRLRLTMQWTPRTQNPRPVDVLPLYMDVNLTVGGTNTFTVPPGKSTRSWEFVLPVDGRLLAVSGHLHDYGTIVRLEDASTGKVITSVGPKKDRRGTVVTMERRLFGVSGNGLRLEQGKRYRVIAEYDNPTGHALIQGGMAHLVALFAPENMSKLPPIDPNDPTYQRDLASLFARGQNHQH